MRWSALILTLTLAGCVPDFLMPPPAAPATYRFDRGGIQPDGTTLRVDFGRAQQGTIETASRLFGSLPDEILAVDECGAGQVDTARWPGVSLNFIGGDFAGWVLGAPGLSAGGLMVGMPVSALPPTEFVETSLGTEFEIRGVYGLILPGESEVAQLWAGTTCFFR